MRIDGPQIVNQLGQIFDAVNVVVRWRRNERRARRGVANPRDVLGDFLRGQLAAFPRLGALRHFDFEFLGAHEILRRHAKASGSNLLDFAGSAGNLIEIAVLSTFTGVAAATQLVHGDGERFVCFGAQGAQGHRLGAEPREDRLDRLDFADWESLFRKHLEKIAQECRSVRLGELLEGAVSPRLRLAHVRMQPANKLRRSGVQLRAFTEAVQTVVCHFLRSGGKGRSMHLEIILEEHVERLRSRITSGILKIFPADVHIQAEQFKEMAVAIARKRGDAHASQDFAKASKHAFAHVLETTRFLGFRKLFTEVGDDRARAGSQQHGHMMGVENLGAFDHQGHIRQTLFDQTLPCIRGSQKRWQRCALRPQPAIGKEEELRAFAATQRGSFALSQTAARARDSLAGRKCNIDGLHGGQLGNE